MREVIIFFVIPVESPPTYVVNTRNFILPANIKLILFSMITFVIRLCHWVHPSIGLFRV